MGDVRHRLGAHSGQRDVVRAAVLSQQRLLREALCSALGAKGIGAAALPLPMGVPTYHGLRRELAAVDARVALLVTEVDDVSQLRNCRAVIAAVGVPCIVLTQTALRTVGGALLDAGAHAALPTVVTIDEVVEVIRGIGARGHPPNLAEHVQLLEEWWATPDEPRDLTLRLERLSAREMEVLSQLAKGDTVRGIATHAVVSEGTVRAQLRSIYRKLGVKSQLQAVAAFRQVNKWLQGGVLDGWPRADDHDAHG